jgi:hypothetical protein
MTETPLPGTGPAAERGKVDETVSVRRQTAEEHAAEQRAKDKPEDEK